MNMIKLLRAFGEIENWVCVQSLATIEGLTKEKRGRNYKNRSAYSQVFPAIFVLGLLGCVQ